MIRCDSPRDRCRERFRLRPSPDSVQSTVCKQEIDRAVESGKRIVPLVCRDISGLEIHPALKERNYIFLRTEEERAKNLPKL